MYRNNWVCLENGIFLGDGEVKISFVQKCNKNLG